MVVVRWMPAMFGRMFCAQPCKHIFCIVILAPFLLSLVCLDLVLECQLSSLFQFFFFPVTIVIIIILIECLKYVIMWCSRCWCFNFSNVMFRISGRALWLNLWNKAMWCSCCWCFNFSSVMFRIRARALWLNFWYETKRCSCCWCFNFSSVMFRTRARVPWLNLWCEAMWTKWSCLISMSLSQLTCSSHTKTWRSKM